MRPMRRRDRRHGTALAAAQVAGHHARHAAARARVLVAARRPGGRRRRRRADAPRPGAAIAFGLVADPVRVHRAGVRLRAPDARPAPSCRRWACCLLVGIPVSALAADAVTGIVAGVGAGGIVALRADARPRLARSAPPRVAVAARVHVRARARGRARSCCSSAPIFPFTGLGLADHLSEWRLARAQPTPEAAPPVDR